MINSVVFAERMGGVAVKDEMERRKHTECHLRVVCIPVCSRLSRLIPTLSSDLAGVDKVPKEAN